MKNAESTDRVKIHYTGKLDDGTVVISSDEGNALEFVIGDNQILEGVEDAVTGMSVGEQKTVKVSPEKAFGPKREDLVVNVPKNEMPQSITLKEGIRLQMKLPNGTPLDVTIAGITEDEVTLDANHPLAGKDITFDLELVEIL
jgi:peptidylprolyl isomerase